MMGERPGRFAADNSSNIEWLYGYDKRFGITALDEQLVRHPKNSSKLLRQIFEHFMQEKQ